MNVSASAGNVVGSTVVDIPLNTDLVLTVDNGTTDCETVATFTGPASCPTDCEFPLLSVGNALCDAVNSGNYRVAFAVDPSATSVTIMGGTDNGDGTATGTIGTDMLITATNGACVSEVAVPSPADCVNPCEEPLISISSVECDGGPAGDYLVRFYTSPGATVTSTAGAVGAGIITDIPSGTDITLTISFAGCEDQSVGITAPMCGIEAFVQDPCLCNNDAEVNEEESGTFSEFFVVTGLNGGKLTFWTDVDNHLSKWCL